MGVDTDLGGLMGHILAKAREAGAPNTAEGLARFADSYLSENPPVRIQYMRYGLSVVLHGGESLPFSSVQKDEDPYKDSGVMVTGMFGYNDVLPK